MWEEIGLKNYEFIFIVYRKATIEKIYLRATGEKQNSAILSVYLSQRRVPSSSFFIDKIPKCGDHRLPSYIAELNI